MKKNTTQETNKRKAPQAAKPSYENSNPNILIQLADALEKSVKKSEPSVTLLPNSPSPRMFSGLRNHQKDYSKFFTDQVIAELQSKTDIYSKKVNNMKKATNCVISIIQKNLPLCSITPYLVQWYEYYTAFLDQNYYFRCGHIIRKYHQRESEGFVHSRGEAYMSGNDKHFHLTIKSYDGFQAVAGYFSVSYF